MVIFSISVEYSENSEIISSVMGMAPHRLRWAARSEHAWSSSFFVWHCTAVFVLGEISMKNMYILGLYTIYCTIIQN